MVVHGDPVRTWYTVCKAHACILCRQTAHPAGIIPIRRIYIFSVKDIFIALRKDQETALPADRIRKSTEGITLRKPDLHPVTDLFRNLFRNFKFSVDIIGIQITGFPDIHHLFSDPVMPTGQLSIYILPVRMDLCLFTFFDVDGNAVPGSRLFGRNIHPFSLRSH